MMKSALAFVDHGIWTFIGMILFMTIFAVMTWKTIRMKKSAIDELASLPLDKDNV